MKVFPLLLSLFTLSASAADSDWQTTWDGTLYGYGNRTSLRKDSLLNPDNQIAGLPQRSDVAELRLNFKAENDTVRITARPIGSVRELNNDFGSQQVHDGYFSQWQVRMNAAEGWNVAAGREVLNWGAGQFRSPSSPFYFDNGRTDPMRELVGMDVAKLAWTPDMQTSATLARIVRSGYGAMQPDMWRDSWLAKIDRRGSDWAWGAVAVQVPHAPAFYGAHGQVTLTDAVMLYGEAGSSALPFALQSSADSTQPFTVQSPSARRTATLAGLAYTFEDGKSLTAEYLYDGHGYNHDEEQAYFDRATTAPPGLALGLAPRLLGQDYLHLVWQNNMMGDIGYWRLMYTRNLTDNGSELAGYAETVLTSHLSVFVLAILPVGDARQEFSALWQRSITAGVKIALP